MISVHRDWRWWLPWRLWLLVAGLAWGGVVTAKAAYWAGYTQGFGDAPPLVGMVAGGPVFERSGGVRIEVEVVDGADGRTRTEQVVIDGVPEPGVAGLLGAGLVLAVMRRRRCAVSRV